MASSYNCLPSPIRWQQHHDYHPFHQKRTTTTTQPRFQNLATRSSNPCLIPGLNAVALHFVLTRGILIHSPYECVLCPSRPQRLVITTWEAFLSILICVRSQVGYFIRRTEPNWPVRRDVLTLSKECAIFSAILPSVARDDNMLAFVFPLKFPSAPGAPGRYREAFYDYF